MTRQAGVRDKLAESLKAVTPPEKRFDCRWTVHLVPVVTAIAIGWVRFRLLDIPLERDEGVFAYIGQRLLLGEPPYISGYSMHMPVLYLAYAAFLRAFGETAAGIHAGILVLNILSAGVVYLIGRRLAGSVCGALASSFFLVLSAAAGVDGLNGNAEHVVLFFTACGTWLALRGREPGGRAVLAYGAGVFLGLAFVTKQTALLFALPPAGLLFFGSGDRRWSVLLRFAAGWCFPLVLVFAWMYSQSDFDRFWFWTFVYPVFYGFPSGSGDIWGDFLWAFRRVVSPFSVIWIMAAAGLAAAWLGGRERWCVWWLSGWLFTAALAVSQGFYFRPHYFLYLSPVVALAAGWGLSGLTGELWKETAGRKAVTVVILLAAGAILQGFFLQRTVWLKADPDQYSRLNYGTNPFPESVRIGQWIEQNTRPEDRIAVAGSEAQILFYSKRQSATPHLFMYGLMEPHDFALEMQKEMAANIELHRPEIMVFVHGNISWLRGPESYGFLFDWLSRYLTDYEKVGIVDILPGRETRYVFGPEALSYQHGNHLWITLFRRKPERI